MKNEKLSFVQKSLEQLSDELASVQKKYKHLLVEAEELPGETPLEDESLEDIQEYLSKVADTIDNLIYERPLFTESGYLDYETKLPQRPPRRTTYEMKAFKKRDCQHLCNK